MGYTPPDMSKSLGHFLTALIFIVVGLGVGGYGLYTVVDIAEMMLNGERVEATVTESVKNVEYMGKGRTSTSYDITVSYTDARGATHSAQPPVNDDKRRRKGQTVAIYYMPDEPERVMLDTWTSKWAPAIPFVFGLIFTGAGVFLFRQTLAEGGRGRLLRPESELRPAGMCIPAHWVKETREIAGMRFRLHGSSNASMEEARERLEARAAIQAALHEEGRIKLSTYKRRLNALRKQETDAGYGVAIFEPTLETPGGRSVVTRNRYGAEVLNTTELCFIDIDDYPLRWCGMTIPSTGGRHKGEQRLLRDLATLCRREPDLGIRAYRTAAGWRLIVEGQGLSPDSQRMEELCSRLHADEAYELLCAKQQCWRARLTPKPGRMGERLGRYPQRMASDTPAEGEADWLARYDARRAAFAVCRLLDSFGRPCTHPLVAWHDERTRALKQDWPLA